MSAPGIKILDIAYPRLRSPDLDAMEEFLTEFGMVKSARTKNALYMRGTGPAHHLHITELGEPSFVSLAYYARSEDDLYRIADHPDAVSGVQALNEPGGGKRVLLKEGGSRMSGAAAPDQLLLPEELTQLVNLAKTLPGKYPQLADAQGRPAPADIEFGFLDGKLMLFQIRPFLQNQSAMRNQYLSQLDAGLRRDPAAAARMVDLRETPAVVPPPAEPKPQPGPIIQRATDSSVAVNQP